MKYEKPEIRCQPAAVEAILGAKDSSMLSDGLPDHVTTLNAYQADE